MSLLVTGKSTGHAIGLWLSSGCRHGSVGSWNGLSSYKKKRLKDNQQKISSNLIHCIESKI